VWPRARCLRLELLPTSLEVSPAAPVSVERHHAGEVGVRQALELLLQAGLPAAQPLPALLRQLENRFHPILLPRWENDAELGRLLVSFEAMLPLCEPSHLGSPAMRALVMQRSEGTIGEVAMLLVQAATAALLAGRESIDPAAIEAADYQPPSLRRRLFERNLH
jgi:hypothetical protein